MRARFLITVFFLLAFMVSGAGLPARAEGPNEPAPGGPVSVDGGTAPSAPRAGEHYDASHIYETPPVLPKTDDAGNPLPPQPLAALENIPDSTFGKDTKKATPGLPYDIRGEALREAALSYGARGGLAWRTYAIRIDLERRATALNKVFDFRQLLIPAPSGLLIEPPVVSEEQKAMMIEGSGAEAAVADRVYNITVQARIVSGPRNWRSYLAREWAFVVPPPDILRPWDAVERRKWITWVDEGWKLGVEQADTTFQDDLSELTGDYQGMIRYRMLLAQGIITPPYTLQTDRGITGGGDKMRVGDRDVQITTMPELLPGAQKWRPANQ